MKIPLHFLEDNAELGDALVLKSQRKMIPAEFIFDTGSPQTVIPYYLAVRLNIPIKNSTKKELILLGGSKYKTAEYHHLKFIFTNHLGQPIEEEFPVKILIPTSLEKEKMHGEFKVILGLDFLKERNYRLYVNLRRRQSFLKKNRSTGYSSYK